MLVKQTLRYLVVTRLFLAVVAQQPSSIDDISLRFSYYAPENTPKGAVLFNFTARYSDNHHDVVVTASSSYVTVERVSGSNGLWNVRLNTILDRETQSQIPLPFDAQGDDVQNSLSFQTILIVTDVNDNPPKFETIFYTADIKENTPVGTSVFRNISTTDLDTGIGHLVSYDMTYLGSRSEEKFAMNSTDGSVKLTGPLNFEKINLYNYIVTATDGGGLSSTADLIFKVLDVQDTPPFFIGLPYTVSVNEDTKAHTVLLQIEAEDGDRFPGISNAVKYNITGESCVGLFQLNTITGALSVGNTQLDRDSKPLTDVNGVCSVTVQATEIDTHPPQLGNTTATTTVTITVVDLNDNAPTFSSPSFTATIKENSPPGVSLTLLSNGHIMVSDKDQGTNSLLTISLRQSGDTFDLEQTHIQSNGPVSIRVKNPALLDYEKSNTLSFTIVARDNPAQGTGMSASATVTVNIQPVNEFTPEFIAMDIKASVPEGSPVGHLVVNASAFDRDKGGSDGKITYSLQNDQGMFRIDPNTGVVTVASQATDREKKDTYNLLVQAQDGGGLLNITSLTIIIDDINDNKPIFQRTQYDAILSENSTTFARPLRLEASDDDKPGTQNSKIIYTLSQTSSPPGYAASFHINPLTGEVTVVRPLDYESVSFLAGQPGTITLTAVATDQGQPPLSSTVHFTITLLDINDNAPNFTQSSCSQIIKEDASLAPVTHSPDTWKYQCEINENVTDILWILQSTNETETLSRCSVESESCDQRLEDLARATINSTSSFLYISDSFVGQKDGRVGYAEIINGLRGEIRFDARTNPMNRANGPSTETTEQTDASTDSPAGTDSLAAWQYQCQIRENVTDVLWILQVGNETETLSRCYIGSESCDQRLDDCAMATINRTSSLFNISANLEKVKAGRVGYAEMINGLNGEIRFDAKRNPIKWPCGPLTVTTGMLPSTKQTSDSTDYSTDYSTGRTSP